VNRVAVKKLLKQHGGGFAKALGIQLRGGREGEVFKWFLASFLYGARITGSIAAKTYQEFERRGVVTPEKIRKTGWHGLVEILDAGGYVRYDFSTATRLLSISDNLIEHYGGKLNNVHDSASNPKDLENRILGIGKGIGSVTANIFLRELRCIWSKADPALSDLAMMAAEHLGWRTARSHGSMLEQLNDQWKNVHVQGSSFIDFEAALVRLGRDYCRKKRHANCPMVSWCATARQAASAG